MECANVLEAGRARRAMKRNAWELQNATCGEHVTGELECASVVLGGPALGALTTPVNEMQTPFLAQVMEHARMAPASATPPFTVWIVLHFPAQPTHTTASVLDSEPASWACAIAKQMPQAYPVQFPPARTTAAKTECVSTASAFVIRICSVQIVRFEERRCCCVRKLRQIPSSRRQLLWQHRELLLEMKRKAVRRIWFWRHVWCRKCQLARRQRGF